jgi:hypothetical protein
MPVGDEATEQRTRVRTEVSRGTVVHTLPAFHTAERVLLLCLPLCVCSHLPRVCAVNARMGRTTAQGTAAKAAFLPAAEEPRR